MFFRLIQLAAALVAVAALLPGAALAQGKFSLQDILLLAVKRNPTLEASAYSVEALKAQLTQARSGWYPQISLATQGNRYGQQPTAEVSTSTFYNEYYNQFTVTQLITDFGQTSAGARRGEHNLAAGRAGMASTLAGMVRDVSKAYYDILVKQALIGVNEKALEIKEQYRRKAEAFVNAGLKAKIYATKAKVDVANAKLALVQARYNLKNSFMTLENLLGGPPAKGDYQLKNPTAQPRPPADLEQLKGQADKVRPEIKQARERINSARALVGAYQAYYLPTLQASTIFGWLDYDFPMAEYWQLQLALAWKLFDGFKREGQIGEARANMLQYKAQLREAKLKVYQEVSQAYFDCIKYHESIEASRESVNQALENMEAAQARFETGASSAIEVSDAIELLINARSSLAQAFGDYYSAMAQLDYSLGRLPEYLFPAADKAEAKAKEAAKK